MNNGTHAQKIVQAFSSVGNFMASVKSDRVLAINAYVYMVRTVLMNDEVQVN